MAEQMQDPCWGSREEPLQYPEHGPHPCTPQSWGLEGAEVSSEVKPLKGGGSSLVSCFSS